MSPRAVVLAALVLLVVVALLIARARRRRRVRELAQLAAIESERAHVVGFMELARRSYERVGLVPPGWVAATIASGGVPVEPRRVRQLRDGRRVVIPPDWSDSPSRIVQEPRDGAGDPSADPPSSEGPQGPGAD